MTDSTAPANGWRVFHGKGTSGPRGRTLPPPMRARRFAGSPPVEWEFTPDPASERRLGPGAAQAFQLSEDNLDMVNAALYLRRPLLVTGSPGLGKSSLAYLVARELDLGPVLKWAVTSRSGVQDGLYRYDALRRLEEATIAGRSPADDSGDSEDCADSHDPDGTAGGAAENPPSDSPDIADYLALGPLGTALLPSDRPRVLLIDELDKADVDLPNDLLHVFEDGEYEIAELRRIRRARPRVWLAAEGNERLVPVVDGKVVCSQFPFVVMTSNGEREFPAAFLRRCLRLHLSEPKPEQLAGLVRAHLDEDADTEYADIISLFLQARGEGGTLPADRLLGAIQLVADAGLTGGDRERLARRIINAGQAG